VADFAGKRRPRAKLHVTALLCVASMLVLMPAFGAGLTWCSHLVRWGERVTPKGTTDVDLPPADRSALEIVRGYLAKNRQPS